MIIPAGRLDLRGRRARKIHRCGNRLRCQQQNRKHHGGNACELADKASHEFSGCDDSLSRQRKITDQRANHSKLPTSPAITSTVPSRALYSRCFQYNAGEKLPPSDCPAVNRGTNRGTRRAYSMNSGNWARKKFSSERTTGT